MTVELNKMKLPKWYSSKPELWFMMAEPHMEAGGLDIAKLADQKKMFTLVLLELPENVAITVKSCIKKPKAGTKYNDLKKAILKHQESPEEAFVWVMETKLGDQKPSALAEQMRNYKVSEFHFLLCFTLHEFHFVQLNALKSTCCFRNMWFSCNSSCLFLPSFKFYWCNWSLFNS